MKTCKLCGEDISLSDDLDIATKINFYQHINHEEETKISTRV